MINILQNSSTVGTGDPGQQAAALVRVQQEIRTQGAMTPRNVEQAATTRRALAGAAEQAREQGQRAVSRLTDEAVQAAQERRAEQARPASPTMLQQLVSQFNQNLSNYTSLRFQVNEGLDSLVVRVVDQETDQLVRQIPPDEMITLAKRMEEFAGLLFDKRV